MIIFHEGMPGSGKSFAAMKDHIIPALKAGRHVWARMNGLDHQRIAEVAEIDIETVEELLHEIPEGKVLETFAVKNDEWKIPPDTLVILDELQNFYPQKRNSLDPETTKFVAEHRHRGMDIVAMGQLLKDCHRTWVNRVNRKIQFLNKDVVGKPDEYKWKMFNGHPDSKGQVVFTETTSGASNYDPKYFGTYKSFRDETNNTDRLADDRANVFKSPVFRKWLPILGVVAIVSLGYIGYLFKGDGLAGKPQPPKVKPVKTVIEQDGKIISETAVSSPQIVSQVPPKTVIDDDWPDVITETMKTARPRLALALRTAHKTKIEIEFRDPSNQVVESLSHDQIKTLGWSIMVSDDLRMVALNRNGHRIMVTSWPVPNPLGEPSQPLQERVREESKRDLRVPEHQRAEPQVVAFKPN